MAPVAGKYTFDKEENLDAYLKAIGMQIITNKFYNWIMC